MVLLYGRETLILHQKRFGMIQNVPNLALELPGTRPMWSVGSLPSHTWLLDFDTESATLATLEKAATALGRRLHIALV